MPEDVAHAVERLVADDPAEALAELRRRAPAVAESIDMRNPRRVSRALALARVGTVVRDGSHLWTDVTRHPTLLVGVVRPRPVLDRLIAQRVQRELDDGLLAELEAALATPGASRSALQIIGVREVLAIRAGTLDPVLLADALAARTRRLARAQLTWLRKTPDATELDLGERPTGEAVAQLLSLWVGAARPAVPPVGDSSTIPG